MLGRRSRQIGLIVVLAAWAAACATHPGPRVLPPTGVAVSAAGAGSSVARTARAYVGVPYRLGGASPSGFDCSGLVAYVFAQHGVTVPRDVRSQWQAGQPIGLSAIRPGDLIFFNTSGRGPSHVSIALDRQSFVHAPSARGVVRIESLASSYWSARVVGARRVLGRR